MAITTYCICNAKTENGIEYSTALYTSNMEYERIVNTLDRMAPAIDGFYEGSGTTQAYTIGNRSKTNSQLAPADMLRRWGTIPQ